MKNLALLFSLLALASCSAGQPCSSDNCTGCCDSMGACQAGSSTNACGSGGFACLVCPSNFTCGAASCVESVAGGGGGSTGGGTGGGGSTGGGSGGGSTGGGTGGGGSSGGGSGGGSSGGGSGGGSSGGGSGGGSTGGGSGGGSTGGGSGGGGLTPLPTGELFSGEFCFNGWCSERDGAPSVKWKSISFASPAQGFVVAQVGGIARWTGSNWVPSPAPDMNPMNAVFAIGSNAWIVGEGAMRFEGATWQRITAATGTWNAVHGTSPNDVWLVGTGGRISHWDGTSLTPAASGTSAELLAVHALSPTEAYAVGRGGVALRYQGLGWTAVTSGTTVDLVAINSDATSVVAIGAQRAIRIASGTVTQLAGMPITLPKAVVSSPEGVWVFGSGNAQAVVWDGSSWIAVSAGGVVQGNTQSVAYSEPGRLWLTERGKLVVKEGLSWRVVSQPQMGDDILSLDLAVDGRLTALASTAFLTYGPDGGWQTDSVRTAQITGQNPKSHCQAGPATFMLATDGGVIELGIGRLTTEFNMPATRIVCGTGASDLVISRENWTTSAAQVYQSQSYLRAPDGGWTSVDYNARLLLRVADAGFEGVGELWSSPERLVSVQRVTNASPVILPFGTTYAGGARPQFYATESDEYLVVMRADTLGSPNNVVVGNLRRSTGTGSTVILSTGGLVFRGLDSPGPVALVLHGDSLSELAFDGGIQALELPDFGLRLQCDRRTRRCWVGGVAGAIWRRQF